MHQRIGFEARGLDACLDHPQSAIGENRPLERLVGLKAYNDFIFAIDIAGLVGEQRRRGLNINREHALLSLVGEVRLQFCPNGFCALRWAREKVLIPRVRLDVPDDEIPNVDGILPVPRGLDACLDHPQSAIGENRPLERLVGLKAYNHFIFAIDIAGLVGEQRRRGLNINREHALLSLVREIRLQFCPNGFCALRWACEKVLIPKVRLDVPDDEIPNIDGILPVPRAKAVPAISAADFLC